MPILGLLSHPVSFILGAIALIVSLSIHEFAHAITADKLGDPTPRLQGRVTLNPMAHLDPLGTLALFFVGFGWGKPVMFDPYNLKSPRRDAALIAAAGPISNILIALVSILVFKLTNTVFSEVLLMLIFINLRLAFFNLIPVHPLDGGKILIGLAPRDVAHEWDQILHQYGIVILLFLIIPFNGHAAVDSLISPIVTTILRVFL